MILNRRKILITRGIMSRKYGLFLFSVVSSLAILALAGCGGSSVLAPRPLGGFTNANLSGTYAFLITGTNTGGFFGIAGSLQADGNGNITSGTIDVNSPGTVGVQTNVGASGTYIVHADGRGAAALNTSLGTINVDFVLLSSQHGFIIRFDNNATGSGSIDQQTSSAFSLSSLAGSLVFNVGGVDGAGQNPEASAGVVTVDASGNINSGVQDTNDNGTPSTNIAVTPTAGAVSVPSAANGRGTVAITTAAGTRNFAFYVIGANQVRMIEIDSAPILTGDAFRASASAISGSFAFTISGAAAGTAFAAGGIIDTDGAGNVLNTSVEDVNSGGTINSGVGLSGTYSVAANGRGVLTMNGGTINDAIYPTTAGIQVLRIDNNVVASGTAFQQSGSFSNSSINGRFGGGVTGVDLIFASEFDSVSRFTADGNGNIAGAMDLNDGGSLTAGLALSGTYTLGSNGRSTSQGILKTAARNLPVIYYAVSSSRVLFIEVDSSVAVGAFQQQQ
jgi:hypothetical protein